MSYLADNSPASTDVNRKYLDIVRRWPAIFSHQSRWLKIRSILIMMLRLSLLPFLFMTSLLVMVILRISLAFNGRRSLSSIHELALAQVPSLVKQYPMHFYPTLAKAFEIGFIKEHLAEHLGKQKKFVEVAVGEGTLSARVFDGERQVTALDLNPYSLVKASKLDHICRSIVCDGQNLPLRQGAYDLLLSTNFLSHVTRKEATIASWSRCAQWIIFNDETPFWSTGWAVPYLLKKVGLKGMAAQRARSFNEYFLQQLMDKAVMEKQVGACCDIHAQASFMSERTFFYSSLASFFMLCPGAPTPVYFKKLFLGPLRFFVVPVAIKLAEMLIRFDAYQDRSTDTFMMFVGKSRVPRSDESEEDLMCPRCGDGTLDSENCCLKCGTVYPVKDGMLFLLPEELDYVTQEYSSEIAATIPSEHL